ncbi:MAG: hypothetical protein QXV69_05410 [Sulfolobaceae archaeon]
MKIKVPYNKILTIFSGHEIEQNGDEIKIIFKPPSTSEAASSNDIEYEVRRYYVIEGKIEGDDVVIYRVYLKDENYIRDLDEEEVKIWLDYLLSLES